jgi:hypothetical protein
LRKVAFFRWFTSAARLALATALALAAAQAQTAASNVSTAGAQAASPSVQAKAPALLPSQFGGWQMQGAAQTSANAQVADAANAAVLKEYRFSDFAAANYTRDDGRTLKIRAARFADASGAFGAYTFYLQPEMAREEIDDQAASTSSGAGERVLFYRGQILIDALFSQQSAMSAAQLRELAGMLPVASGSTGALPPVLLYMPTRGYVRNSQKYVEGPAALAAIGAPISADLVDFGTSAEVTVGHYDTPSGEATLVLIYYTNPQVAIEHVRRIDPAHQAEQTKPGLAMIGNQGAFYYKRSGPIVALASGPVSESDAKSLLGGVNYEASVTWNQATDNHQVHDLYSLVLNVVILCGIIGGFAIVAGIAFGGLRVGMKRWFPDRVFDRPEQMEFISLRLAETAAQGPSQSGPSGAGEASQNPR